VKEPAQKLRSEEPDQWLCVTVYNAYFVTTYHGVTDGPRPANGKYHYTVNSFLVLLQVEMVSTKK
jgi:hypothetical protein